MEPSWVDRWNERYSSELFAYGELPNEYLKQQLGRLQPGTILLPAEGEGRNAVFAAEQGWNVSAFDASVEGRKKALQLAKSRNVSIDYQVAQKLEQLSYGVGQFDVMALIYAHFAADIKSNYHRTLDQFVRKGGWVIFEAFSKNHLAYVAQNEKVGGPREIDMLFSIEEIKADFPHYEVIELEEKEIQLSEGRFHNGTGSVIRFVGRKK